MLRWSPFSPAYVAGGPALWVRIQDTAKLQPRLGNHLLIQHFKPGWLLIRSTSQLFTLENFSSLYEVVLKAVISQKTWELKTK